MKELGHVDRFLVAFFSLRAHDGFELKPILLLIINNQIPIRRYLM